MTLSRRSFFTGLATLIAAPAIVRAESLMKLAPTKIAKLSMRELVEYSIHDQAVTRLDVLYGSMHVRPEWSAIVPEFPLDELSERILAPMVNRLAQDISDAVMQQRDAEKMWSYPPASKINFAVLANKTPWIAPASPTNSHE